MNVTLIENPTNGTIYDKIWTAISERKLRPGTRLKEEKLAEIFDISRARVRHALAMLEHDGLVTILANRGAFVAEPTIDQARDIFFARQAVETSLIERLCTTRTAEDITTLRAHVVKERDARVRGDTTATIRLSGGFHFLIGELAGSAYLAEVLRDLISRTSLIIAMYQTRTQPDCGPDEHDAVVNSIEAGDIEQAKQQMIHHLGHIEQRLDLEAPLHHEADLEDILK